MKSRILSIVLAMSMIAGLFAALPVSGAVDYTGTVITTDDSGMRKTEFIQGEDVYVNVTTWAFGVLSTQQVTVTLARSNDGHAASSFTTNTNNPVTGVYNSTIAGSHLHLARREVIQAGYKVSQVYQSFTEMTSLESGTTSYQDVHL